MAHALMTMILVLITTRLDLLRFFIVQYYHQLVTVLTMLKIAIVLALKLILIVDHVPYFMTVACA